MADPETVRRLAQGVEQWNTYRRDEGIDHPDLTRIKIVNSSLQSLDLSGADLDGAELQNVDLRRANFRAARVNGLTADGVCLDEASLKGAEIKGSDFDKACIRWTDLSNVNAYELRIRRSILCGSDLSGATFRGYTHLYNCDLSDVQATGLTVEMGVIKRPVANEALLLQLKTAGFNLVELENQPLLKDHPSCDAFSINVPDEQYGVIVANGASYWISEGRYDVFISHVSTYKVTIATPLADEFINLGLRVWIDERRIGLLDDLVDIIEFGIRSSRFGVVILTPDFFGRIWTDREFSLLTNKRVFLVLHDIEPEQLKELHPGLDTARLHLTWGLGKEEVAGRIYSAIRQPPRTLG